MAGGGDWLPVVSHPIEGNPRVHPKWEGYYVHVPTIAASRLALAENPYVLRYRENDVEGRLHKNDLVLVSQSTNASAEISVVLVGKKCCLARRQGRGWGRVANRQRLGTDCVLVGHCLGVLWSALS